MGTNTSTWRNGPHNPKNGSRSTSGIAKDGICCMPSSTWEKEEVTCDSADYKGSNIHAWNASKTTLLEAEQVKAKAVMGIRRRIIV